MLLYISFCGLGSRWLFDAYDMSGSQARFFSFQIAFIAINICEFDKKCMFGFFREPFLHIYQLSQRKTLLHRLKCFLSIFASNLSQISLEWCILIFIGNAPLSQCRSQVHYNSFWSCCPIFCELFQLIIYAMVIRDALY